MKVEPEFFDVLMACALEEARAAYAAGEVPVGAVIAHGQDIIARAHNETEAENDATCHAELLAIRRASEALGSWRLNDMILCVTLEPCTMCAGAIRLSRLPVIVYGAADEKMGAFGSLFDLSQDPRLGQVPRIVAGVQAEECSAILSRFFKEKREG